MQSRTKKVALYGLCIALAFVFSYIESLFPVVGIPGMKLGLTNIVVVVALYYMDAKAAFFINVVRIILVAATFGTGLSFLFSIAGGMLSFLVMRLMKKMKYFQLVTVSVTGSVCHNAGQILVAMFVLHTSNVVWYFGILCITGVVTGVLIGIVTSVILQKLPKGMLD